MLPIKDRKLLAVFLVSSIKSVTLLLGFYMVGSIIACVNQGEEKIGFQSCIPREILTENGRLSYQYDCWDSGGRLLERKYYKESIRPEYEYTYYENGLRKSIIRYFDRSSCEKYEGHPICFAPDGKTEVGCVESLHGCKHNEYSCIEGADYDCPYS